MADVKSTLFNNLTDEDAMQDYLDAPVETLWSIDLMEANPDIRNYLNRGSVYEIEVNKIVFNGQEYFEAYEAEETGGDIFDEMFMHEIFDNFEEARVAADELFMAWKDRWAILLRCPLFTFSLPIILRRCNAPPQPFGPLIALIIFAF